MKENCNTGGKDHIVRNKHQSHDSATNQTVQPDLFYVEPVAPHPKEKQEKQKNTDDYVFDIIDALSSPILTFSVQWTGMLPKRLLDNVTFAKMKALMLGERLATYSECAIYIYTRTLEAPMDHEWTDIYTHVSCKALQDHFGENHWNEVLAPKELNEWLTSKLTRLRQHIYQKRREILRKRLKEQEKEKKDVELSTEGTKSPIIQEPPSLFPDLTF